MDNTQTLMIITIDNVNYLTRPKGWKLQQPQESEDAYFERLSSFTEKATHWLCEEEDEDIIKVAGISYGKVYPLVESEDGQWGIIDNNEEFSLVPLAVDGQLLIFDSSTNS